MEIKVNKTLTVLVAFTVMSCAFGFGGLMGQISYDGLEVRESGIVGLIVGSLVGVLVASALLPVIANQTTTLEADAAGDLETSEEGLIGTWNLLIIVGVMLAIISLALV